MTSSMLIGSRALEHWISPDFVCRSDADWDYIGTPDHECYRCEVHSPEHLNNQMAMDLYNTKDGVCSLKGLYLIKRSHLWRDYQFDKHITMFHRVIQPNLVGTYFYQEDRGFLKDRTKLTKEAYPQGNPKLNQSNEDFFDDAVDKVYDHDYLHELYAYRDAPMYTYLKSEGQEGLAWCEKDLWDRFTIDMRHQCVAEECYVIATERYMVPNQWQYPSKRAYMDALKKVCTTLCSGWFRDHAIDYYPQVLSLYDKEKFNQVKGVLC